MTMDLRWMLETRTLYASLLVCQMNVSSADNSHELPLRWVVMMRTQPTSQAQVTVRTVLTFCLLLLTYLGSLRAWDLLGHPRSA